MLIHARSCFVYFGSSFFSPPVYFIAKIDYDKCGTKFIRLCANEMCFCVSCSLCISACVAGSAFVCVLCKCIAG